MSVDRKVAEGLAGVCNYDVDLLRRHAELAIDGATRRAYLEAARMIAVGELAAPPAELEGRHVTPQVKYGELDAVTERLELLQCVCGAKYGSEDIDEEEAWRQATEADADDNRQWLTALPAPMPCCGAQLFAQLQPFVFQAVRQGAEIVQPPEDHPVWNSDVAGGGMLTLRDLRDQMRLAGGMFAIHGYTLDGNALIDAATPDGVTLDDVVNRQEQQQ